MGKESSIRVYEDFRVGNRVDCPGTRTVSDIDRAAWVQLTGDPIPRFTDAAGNANPLLVFNLAHALVGANLLSNAREELGVSNLIVHRPVRNGSVMHVTCRVIGAREDPTKTSGVIWVRVAARDPRGVVLSYVAWFRIGKRHKQAQGPVDTLPDLPDRLPLRDLHIKRLGAPQSTHETGGRFVFEDYLPGETLFHGAATTLDSHEIRHFSRWLRITRPLHHVPKLEGHRAPAGLAIGLGYALAHDGLENRMGLGGINALRTPNALQPGDTLRSMSQVVATEKLDDTYGAIRMRTFLFRDGVPMTDDPPLITDGKRYYAHIALDMDYWEVVPTTRGVRGS